MKPLPLIPADCTLTDDGLSAQRDRAAALRDSVVQVRRAGDFLQIRFRDGVDESVVAELVEAERSCCSFFRISYEDRELRVAIDDPARREALDTFTMFFLEAA